MSGVAIRIDCPAWVDEVVAEFGPCTTDDRRMALAIRLARENVDRELGGPFGAVIFERGGATPVGVGVNSVLRLRNSILHAEIVACMIAHQRRGVHSLAAPDLPPHELFTSCDPCAMCLGAAHWSGVHRIVAGATREDALALGFDEGPVFPESYRYLAERGVTAVHGVRRAEARAVLERYRERGGPVYNG